MTEQRPPESLDYPGSTADMTTQPRDEMRAWRPSGQLTGKRVLITGGDSGIGRAVAVLFAKAGADVAICYLAEAEDTDAAHTCELIRQAGRTAASFRHDLAEPEACRDVVAQTVHALGGLDIVEQRGLSDSGDVAAGTDRRAVATHVRGEHRFWYQPPSPPAGA